MAGDDTLRAIMSKRLITVRADDPVSAAVRQMVRHDIGAVLVKRSAKVIGIVTERDILRAAAKRGDVFARRVSAVLARKKLITAKPDDSPLHALELMNTNGIRRVPIFTEGKVVGIVTERDLVKWLLRRPEVILDLLSPEYPAVSRDALVALLKELQVREHV